MYNPNQPRVLAGKSTGGQWRSRLVSEAGKYETFDEFQKAYQGEVKHGTYWHWTNNKDFTIDPKLGPRDVGGMAFGTMEPGKLMVTSDPQRWASYGKRPYVAIVDLSNVPPAAYRQVSRGFGNEFMVSRPESARVVEVVPRDKFPSRLASMNRSLPQSSAALRSVFEKSRAGLSVKPPVTRKK